MYDGLIFPFEAEAVTDQQTLTLIQYLASVSKFSALLDLVKDSLEEKGFLLSLKGSELDCSSQHLSRKGAAILSKCKRLASLICSCNDSLKQSQLLVTYSLHNYFMQLFCPYFIADLESNYKDHVHRFQLCRQQCINLSMADLHIPSIFRCNVCYKSGTFIVVYKSCFNVQSDIFRLFESS